MNTFPQHKSVSRRPVRQSVLQPIIKMLNGWVGQQVCSVSTGERSSLQPVRQALAMGFRQVRPSLSVKRWSLSGPTHSVQSAAPKPGAYECALHLWQRRPSWLAKPAKD